MKTISICGFAVLMAALPVSANANQQVTGRASDETWTGTLTSVNKQKGTLTGKHWLFTKTFNLGDNCTVVALDKQEGALSDLRPGEKVRIHLPGRWKVC